MSVVGAGGYDLLAPNMPTREAGVKFESGETAWAGHPRLMQPLPLNSDRWETLRHAGGSAFDVPAWISRLAANPQDEVVWDNLWGCVLHQMAVSDSAYAIVPHLIILAEKIDPVLREPFLRFASTTERWRVESPNGADEVPADLAQAYFEALRRLDGSS